jgi:hypothetical protein
LTTFSTLLIQTNEINRLANVKSSNVVISGVFPTTRVVIPKSGDSAPGGPTDTRSTGIFENGFGGCFGHHKCVRRNTMQEPSLRGAWRRSSPARGFEQAAVPDYFAALAMTAGQ